MQRRNKQQQLNIKNKRENKTQFRTNKEAWVEYLQEQKKKKSESIVLQENDEPKLTWLSSPESTILEYILGLLWWLIVIPSLCFAACSTPKTVWSYLLVIKNDLQSHKNVDTLLWRTLITSLSNWLLKHFQKYWFILVNIM